MNRDKALELVEQSVGNRNLVKHMIAVGAAMKELAHRLNGDPAVWEIAGLLHDIDYDITTANFLRHGHLSYDIIIEKGLPQEIAEAVRAHPAHEGFMPKDKFEWSLHIVDPLTGLIVAAALMHPTKKIAPLDAEFILRRFYEKRFAAGANREQIQLCEEKLGIALEEFISIVLNGMKGVASELGL